MRVLIRHVWNENGAVYNLDVKATDTVQHLKILIEILLWRDASGMQLSYDNTVLADARTLVSYGITNLAEICLRFLPPAQRLVE